MPVSAPHVSVRLPLLPDSSKVRSDGTVFERRDVSDGGSPEGEVTGMSRSERNGFYARVLFGPALAATLVLLLLPAQSLLDLKIWVASWLPYSKVIDDSLGAAGSDKVLHFGLFAQLAVLMCVGWRHWSPMLRVVFPLLALGAITEAIQSFTPGRSASLGDWVADALGVLLVVWVWRARQRAG